MVEKVVCSYDDMDDITNVDKLIEESKANVSQLLFQFQGCSDLQNLVGNAGGYMGLFLGVKLNQLSLLLVSTILSAYKIFPMI